MNIPLIKPYIDQEIKQRVFDVLDSGYLTEGPVTKEFEQKFASYIGCRNAIAVTSCTTGLEMALRVLNIGQGDEVIVPDYTYPATASVIPIVGASAIIVDVSKDNMIIDYDAIEQAITKKTKAIIPVSAFGNPLDFDRLNEIKRKHNLYIIEDAAPSVGAEFKGIKVGNLADITVFSFHPRKFITTGEGGMITTNNDKWANWLNSYKHFGMDMSGTSREGIKFEIIGTNYKLSNILSAIGLGQLTKIDKLLQQRKDLAKNYIKLLEKESTIKLPITTNHGIHSYQSFIVYHPNRDTIMNRMRKEGIEVQIGTYALHMHKAFNNNPLVKIIGNMENSQWCYDHALTLPLFYDLTNEQQELIVQEIIKSE
ncbi:MAG: DegT/DnrJ/EryC1/StrS aminotransferase family protein [Bacteroidales bacterium]|nr:DegT/DnrJ/EryC1/StrS aminotransferase family protein [Bacteroidales bacterium]